MKCSNNLKQIGLGLHNAHDTRGSFPPMSRYTNNGVVTIAGQDPGEKSNLWISLLPFIEQDNIYKQSNGPNPRNPSIDDATTAPRALGSKVINIYLCPSDANNKPNATWTNGWEIGRAHV